MKVAINSGESGLLLVSAIQKESISIYYSHLSSINFDDTIDMVPAQQSNPLVKESYEEKKEAKNTEDA